MSSSLNPRSQRTVRIRRVVLAGLAVLLGAAAADGQSGSTADLGDLSLEDLMGVRIERVYGASKYEQMVTRAPASVSIVTAAEIKRQGHRTLADILRSVRGLYVTYDRNYENLGMRGFARPGDFNTRVLLLLNGHRVNDNLYSSALIGNEALIDVALIDRVEVIRGPSSSIYGSNAFLGVVNIITRDAGELSGIEVAADAGTSDTYRGRFSYGQRGEDGSSLVLSGTAAATDGQHRLEIPEHGSPANPRGIVTAADDERSHSLFAQLGRGDWTFTTGASRREKQVPTAPYGTVFGEPLPVTDEREFVDLAYEQSLSPVSTFTARTYYDRYAYRAAYPYNWSGPGETPFIVASHDDSYGEGVGGEAQLTRRFGRHTVIAGGELRYDLHLYQASYSGEPRTYGSRDDQSGRSAGIFVQSELVLRDDLVVNLGARHDDYRNFGGTTNPRLALLYTPREGATWKLLYGTAYRAPNAYELYLDVPGQVQRNPDLEPETIATYELVHERILGPGLRLTAAGYHLEIEDLIAQRYDEAVGAGQPRNVDRAAATGVELEVEWELRNGMITRGSWSTQEAKDTQTGRELSNSPRHMGKLGVMLPSRDERWNLGLDAQYYSGFGTVAGQRTSVFAVVDATLTWAPYGERLELSVSANNLLDRDYSYPGSTAHRQDEIQQNGRSVRFGLVFRSRE